MAGQEVDSHRCSVCSCDYTDDEGGIQGYFGILPVSFCPTCFSCMCDMASQYLEPQEEVEIYPDHAELIQHLRGFRDVVINTCHGGFGLSKDAKIAWLERSGVAYTMVPRDDRHSDQRWGPHIIVNQRHWYDKDIPRDDSVLVELVRELGSVANGEHARLNIVRIPANVEWMIEDYDGNEWVSEAHRTWK
jgi:hypothetical protein